MKPKDFQQATADRIVQVFRGGQNRVLLADEVGLGKTIVAREVVRQVAQWHKEELGDDHFKVIYILLQCEYRQPERQQAGYSGSAEGFGEPPLHAASETVPERRPGS